MIADAKCSIGISALMFFYFANMASYIATINACVWCRWLIFGLFSSCFLVFSGLLANFRIKEHANRVDIVLTRIEVPMELPAARFHSMNVLSGSFQSISASAPGSRNTSISVSSRRSLALGSRQSIFLSAQSVKASNNTLAVPATVV